MFGLKKSRFCRYTRCKSSTVIEKAAFFGYDNHPPMALNASYQTLVVNTAVNTESKYVNDSGEITVPVKGFYEISYHVQFMSVNNCCSFNASLGAAIEADQGPGFVFIPGASASCFIIEEAGSLNTPGVGKSIIVGLEAKSVVRVRFTRLAGTTSVKTKPMESSLLIKQL